VLDCLFVEVEADLLLEGDTIAEDQVKAGLVLS